jgi:hypothetical protein
MEMNIKMTFDEWLEKLKKQNPSLDWDNMDENIIAELKADHEEREKECLQ